MFAIENSLRTAPSPGRPHGRADHQHRHALSNWRTAARKRAERAIDCHTRVIERSGGNQQKVVIANVQKPKLIIFDEPARGTDDRAIEQLTDEEAGGNRRLLVSAGNLEPVGPHVLSRLGRIVEVSCPADGARIMYAAAH